MISIFGFNNFIQKGHIKLIKSDSKEIYVSNRFIFQIEI